MIKQSQNNMNIFLKQPAVHFLLIAGLIFWGSRLLPSEQPTLIISKATYEGIVSLEQARKGSTLTRQETDQALQTYIDNELLLTDALASGVHRDTTLAQMIIRKHKAFLTATLPMPEDDELKEFFEQNREQFRAPTRYSLNYRWQKNQTATLLKTSQTADNNQSSQTGHLVDVTQEQLSAYFGTVLTQHITQSTPGSWHGPFVDDPQPPLWVQITTTLNGADPDFNEQRDYVLDAWRKDQATRHLESYLHQLKQQTRIEVES
ncbi:peptidylprolyl isomerase [Reinekea sp. G2M2-21]|uniref:peptidylprolyl isomerase n=1 Tax=Reinekea sp. G2M2-21 TaxID=2788942 RepID=UPI0018AB08CA|nr:peptidylprolyl isomerase [Reinekea sp. G2M2-21]